MKGQGSRFFHFTMNSELPVLGISVALDAAHIIESFHRLLARRNTRSTIRSDLGCEGNIFLGEEFDKYPWKADANQ